MPQAPRPRTCERRQQAAEDFVESAYPVLVDRRLDGQADRRALRRLGRADARRSSSARCARATRAAPRPHARAQACRSARRDRVDAARGEPSSRGYVGPSPTSATSAAISAASSPPAGDTPLWDALSSDLVEERAGDSREPADGVVVVRTAEPQQGPTRAFLAGLYAGLGSDRRARGRRRAGRESSRARSPSSSGRPLDRRRDRHASSAGSRSSLLLAGAPAGQLRRPRHGRGRVLPPIEPLPSGRRAGG